ncbi:MAG TPA: peptide-methionine (R)-S-oxide reductase MsrB [Candidatus Paceibacterota bacterium]|nr:peptide-methionine (R)-S-oxide reductase MsrB [Candidatus Paceibacterota bacterium]
MDNEDLKKRLTEEEYFITQEKGTETPFRNEYWDKKESGMYECKVCGQTLFDSSRKYDSGTGWPSFDEALPGVLKFEQDHSLGTVRTEVMCARCGSHLGHIFDDGPKETTGKRICTNSASLRFKSKS